MANLNEQFNVMYEEKQGCCKIEYHFIKQPLISIFPHWKMNTASLFLLTRQDALEKSV
jgi:hypothetical protein